MALVNGVETAPNSYGVVEGTSGSDRISGTGGTDHLAGGAGVDYLYGGGGNDAFVIRASDMSSDLAAHGQTQDYIYDFGGAGGYSTTNNDFLALTGFSKGSTLTFSGYGNESDHTLQFYTIHDASTGADFKLFIHSLDGKTLSAGDYAFY